MDPASSLYRPLDKANHEIRVLHILPSQELFASSTNTEQIQCSLEYISLDEKPVYNALSYTWQSYGLDTPGHLSTEDRYSVLLDTHEVRVTKNLWSALVQFRETRSASESSYFGPFPAGTPLWVDALCINQTDIPERNYQVSQMRKIYQNAECVNIWLGPKAQDSGMGMDLALDLEKKVRSLGSTKVEQEWINPLMRSSIQDPTYERNWRALTMIYQRPYWNRLWIIQEVVSNIRTYVHVGSKTTHLMPLLTTGQAIYETNEAKLASNQSRLEQAVLETFNSQAIIEARYQFMDPSYEGHHLLDLLHKYRHHTSTNPRDKVYGLASLARSYENTPKVIRKYSLAH